MPDETNDKAELLDKHAPPELDEGDKRIAKKRAKKHNIPQELAEAGRRQEKSVQIVKALTNEYYKKLNELGFVLNAILKFKEDGIIPTFDLRPMNGDEIIFYQKKKEADAKAEADKKMQQATSGPTPVPVEGATAEKPQEQAEEKTGPENEEKVAPIDVPQA